MSACISMQGEYGSHVYEMTGDHRFMCTRCWVLDEDAILAALDGAESALSAALAAREAAEARAAALQGKIDRCVAHIREGQQLQPGEPDAGLEALVVGWVNYHGDCCNFKARAERAEAGVRDVRAETLREAADEVHREGRWQQEMRQRRGQSLSDLSTREYFIDRLALVEQTLRDRAAVAPSEPQDEVLFRTPADWCELFGVIVLDPDGWRADGQSWDQPVTREEFNRRANMSTIGPRSLLSDPQETSE